MPIPPPPPAPTVEDTERERLLDGLRALETNELLQLCLKVRGSPARLRLYLGLLRSRGGVRAQLAACLVCFDLAKQGDIMAQREFTALAPTMSQLAQDVGLVAELLGGDPYLEETWSACRLALEGSDPREQLHALDEDADAVPVGELDLLSDEDLDADFGVEFSFGPPTQAVQDEVEREAAQAEYAALLAKHLGQEPEHGLFSEGGFATASGRDLDRLEGFLERSAAWASRVPTARGLSSLGNLFLATHLRMRTLFGKRNPRRQKALRTGLANLPSDIEAVLCAATIFEFEGEAARLGFEKVLELLLDYVAFCHAKRLDPRLPQTVESYIESERQPAPVFLRGINRRRRD